MFYALKIVYCSKVFLTTFEADPTIHFYRTNENNSVFFFQQNKTIIHSERNRCNVFILITVIKVMAFQ
jgi:hypothetical protein